MDALEKLGYSKLDYQYPDITYVGNDNQIFFTPIFGKYEMCVCYAPNLTYEEVLACAEIMKELNDGN